MKMNSLKAAAAFGLTVLLANTAAAQNSAASSPVGYETVTLAPGQFNLIGFRLQSTAVASGNVTGTTATSLTTDATFSLDADTQYEIQFSNGASITAPGSSFSGSDVTGLEGIDNSFETSFTVTEARTIASTFGENNSAGLASSAAVIASADVIFIPEDGGTFRQVFFSTAAAPFDGWLDNNFMPAADFVLDSTRGVFVQTRASAAPIDLVVTGAVKTTPTAFSAADTFNLVSGVYPAGSTLANSGLSAVLQSSEANAAQADLVQLPDGAGGFISAFFSTADAPFDGWINSSTFAQIPDQPLTTSFFIQRRGPEITGLLTPPDFYSNL